MTSSLQNEKSKKRVATLSRVSTELESQDMSIDNQKKLFEEYCEKKGYEIVITYEERGSGAKLKRVVIEQIKSDIKLNHFDILLVKDLSRLARNIQIVQEVLNLANERGIKIMTTSEAMNAQLENSMASTMIAFLSMSHQFESESYSGRIKSTIQYNQRQGKVHRSTPPYGYTIECTKFVMRDDESVANVRRIFSMYLSGIGIDSIAKQFNDEGIATPSQLLKKKNAGYLWGGTTIRGILTNRVYVGDVVQGKTETISVTSSKRKQKNEEEYLVFANQHEPIIDRQQFESVQALMQSKSKINSKVQTHLFTNIVCCEGCGRGLWYRSSNKGGRYICGGRSRYGVKGCPSPTSINEYELLLLVKQEMQVFIYSIDNNEYWRNIQETLEGKNVNSVINRKDTEMKIHVCNQRIVKVTTAYFDGKIEEHIYHKIVEQSNATIDELNQQLEESEIVDENLQGFESLKELRSELLKYLTDKELAVGNTLLRFVERIVVSREKDVVVCYRFSG